MSKFDAAIECLKEERGRLSELCDTMDNAGTLTHTLDVLDTLWSAIRVLEDWPKREKLIEAISNAENKSLMKLAADLGIPFSAAKVVADRAYKEGFEDAKGEYAPFIEAAGRVDKELAIQWFHQARSDFYEPVVREAIRRMFDALPDKPDAEEKRVEDEAYLRNMDEPGPKEEKL